MTRAYEHLSQIDVDDLDDYELVLKHAKSLTEELSEGMASEGATRQREAAE